MELVGIRRSHMKIRDCAFKPNISEVSMRTEYNVYLQGTLFDLFSGDAISWTG
jgi:hypothetical protein